MTEFIRNSGRDENTAKEAGENVRVLNDHKVIEW